MDNQLKNYKILFLILIVSISLFSFTVDASAESNVLDRVVILETKDNYDKEEAARMKERLGRIHPDIIQALYDRSIVIKLINFPITDLPEYEYLRGEVPRGWEGTGKTWDDVPGAGGNPSVARIGYSQPSEWHGTINLELHELAHVIDSHVFDYISHSKEFTMIHGAEQTGFLPAGYFTNAEEYFAEAFGYYYLGGAKKDELKQQAPKTYAFITKLPFVLSGEVPVEEPVDVPENEVEDTDAPVITLHGDNSTELTLGDVYEELGATAVDNTDGDITEAIEITGEINMAKAGQYVVTYSVTDKAGNNATAERTINVLEMEDTIAPVITLLGDKSTELYVGDLYEELGATADDNVDGDLSEAIVITGEVNTAKSGKYVVTYSVIDNHGNTATTSREISVLEKEELDEIASPATTTGDEKHKVQNAGDRNDEPGVTVEEEDNVDKKEGFKDSPKDEDKDEIAPNDYTKGDGGKGMIENLKTDKTSFPLPSSQTNTYLILLIGLLLTISGSSMLLVRKTA